MPWGAALPTMLHKHSISAIARLGCLLFVAALGLAGSAVSALAASAGCDAVNGGGLNESIKDQKKLTNEFNAGDKLVLTVSKPFAGSLTVSLSSSLGGNQSKVNASNGDTLSLTLTAGSQTVTSSMSGSAEGAISINVVCIPGPPPPPPPPPPP